MPGSSFAPSGLVPKVYSGRETRPSTGLLEYRFGELAGRAGADQHRLLDGSDGAVLVEQCADRGADAVRPVVGLRPNTDPLALGDPVHMDGHVGVL